VLSLVLALVLALVLMLVPGLAPVLVLGLAPVLVLGLAPVLVLGLALVLVPGLALVLVPRLALVLVPWLELMLVLGLALVLVLMIALVLVMALVLVPVMALVLLLVLALAPVPGPRPALHRSCFQVPTLVQLFQHLATQLVLSSFHFPVLSPVLPCRSLGLVHRLCCLPFQVHDLHQTQGLGLQHHQQYLAPWLRLCPCLCSAFHLVLSQGLLTVQQPVLTY